jgi:hypothetical protein
MVVVPQRIPIGDRKPEQSVELDGRVHVTDDEVDLIESRTLVHHGRDLRVSRWARR